MSNVRFVLVTSVLCVAISTGFVRLVPVVHTIRNKLNDKFANANSTIHQEGKEQRNQSLDWEIEVKREIRDLRVTVTYYIVSSDGTTQNALISRSVELCAFLRRPTMDRFLKNFYVHMQFESILPARCPIKQGHYAIRNVRPSDISIPGFLPESDFILEVAWNQKARNEPLAQSRTFGKLIRVVD
ncbi:AGAP011020-PA-like protein [Anopheles sinensis]|uniref:AGAP011020-PA-like protein n=1 Tax=Anopheles sinensis TaxID=74873 RepID=A0A084W984_ANOSI|nr:AGAP011020-PA-like protein [Anopheles sinensis]